MQTINIIFLIQSFNFSNYGFCPPFGIQKISGNLPERYSLEQNYPNPFNPNTIFKFDISRKSIVKIVIYDVTEKEVEELVNSELNPGTYAAKWDGTNFSSGIYFYNMQTEAYSQTKKMILLK